MQYQSTRDDSNTVQSAEAIKMGISPEGGLFVPKVIPQVDFTFIAGLSNLNYNKRAIEILKLFLTDYADEEIIEYVNKAYNKSKFETESIAPVYKLNERAYILELWHGPTCAFKDMALQILPYLLTGAIKKTKESCEIVILTATSGDTGKAALEGFRDIEGTRIIVFYPENGVSEIQRLQMVTQEGSNVSVVAVGGNFDDTQNGIKSIFTDNKYKDLISNRNFKLSSANSINWGRLVPQIIYYFSAYADLLKNEEIKFADKVNFVVPTGNFGNILAAYYAKKMGLPINKLICASNENNVLTDFITTGVYDRNREFKTTVSPSMDILISSNLERLLFDITGNDCIRVKQWMNDLNDKGKYEIAEITKQKIKEIFWAGYCNSDQTLETIKRINEEYSYIIDTHTAVGLSVYEKYINETGDETKVIIASTASPFKFNKSVLIAILGEEYVKNKSEFELLKILSEKGGVKIPKSLLELDSKEILHKSKCAKGQMLGVVNKILGIA